MRISDAQKKIKGHIPDHVQELAGKFISSHYQVYLVGGILRDILLDRDFDKKEIDLATNAHPDDVKNIFKKVIPTGIKHGTVTVLYKTIHFEVTTFRLDGQYSDGRHPDRISYADTIEEDLKRRDFTINAFAYDLKDHTFIDLFKGLDDLKKGIIRTIGPPEERFKEDGLRLMRAIRFSTILGFKIEPVTFRGIEKSIDMLHHVSAERIRDELVKILQSEKPSIGLELARASGILRIILPELLTGFGIDQNKFHKFDVYHHNLSTCDAAPKGNLAVRLASLFHDISKPATKQTPQDDSKESTFYNHEVIGAIVTKKILKRLKFSNEIIEKVMKLIRHHMFFYTEEWTDSAVRRFIRKVGLDLLKDLFLLREADRIGGGIKKGNSYHLKKLQKHIDRILEEENAFSLKDLKVNGHDVMKIKNIPPSSEVGTILNYLLERVLDHPEDNEKETLKRLIREYPLQKPSRKKNNL
ncbi:MAG: HD domain-containing protein [Spirochaetes bacterium]|nr:HD domain-containing protein [Spirochaetota bacterium]